MSIDDQYKRLSDATGIPCQSITVWRTVEHNWGARAGLGHAQFGLTLFHAVERAVDDGIAEFERRGGTISNQQETKI